jgi:two-component system, OmpR family, sensor histidine kinase VicK
MTIRSSNKFFSLLKTPEAQFFLIFTIPFVGFFLVNYLSLSDQARVTAVIAFVAALIIVLMQTIYGVHVHRRIKKEENSFLSVTAHQMRTPLTAVKWTLEELSKKDVREEDRTELTRMASISAQKLTTIIDSFSEIARIEDSQVDYRYEMIELIDFVDRMVREAEPVGKQYGSTVYFERPNEAIEIKADPVKLEVVFSNLINNGIKYNRKGGVVTVRLRRLSGDKRVEVTVEDTGMGISPADKQHLFQKYYRSEDAKRVNVAGSGLGLYLVKTIIDQHNGRIWVESVQGKGSAFHFTLPIER